MPKQKPATGAAAAPSSSRRRRQHLATATLLLIALALLAYGSRGFIQRYRYTHRSQPTLSWTVITHSTDTPDETPPQAACTSHQGATQYPIKISLPTINAAGCLERVGIDQHGAIAVPDNIHAAAWYTHSALPGQPGLSIIDGHVSGRYDANGIFKRLQHLKSGDAFSVTLGSGSLLNYTVLTERSVPLDQAAQVLLTKDPTVASQLNLITCGGQYDRTAKQYKQRVIVSAALVSR